MPNWRDDRLDLVRTFLETHFVRRGMVADFALHDPLPEHGQSEKNFHAHVMLTLRRATAKGLDPVKTREWNSKDLLNVWRAEWAIACNLALERAGKRVRVDHRTLAAQREEALARHDKHGQWNLAGHPKSTSAQKPARSFVAAGFRSVRYERSMRIASARARTSGSGPASAARLPLP